MHYYLESINVTYKLTLDSDSTTNIKRGFILDGNKEAVVYNGTHAVSSTGSNCVTHTVYIRVSISSRPIIFLCFISERICRTFSFPNFRTTRTMCFDRL